MIVGKIEPVSANGIITAISRSSCILTLTFLIITCFSVMLAGAWPLGGEGPQSRFQFLGRSNSGQRGAHSPVYSWVRSGDGSESNKSLSDQRIKEAQLKDYSRLCGEPSNFSLCWTNKGFCTTEERELNASKWRNISIAFVGGSVSRQAHEQLLLELPDVVDTSPDLYRSEARKASGAIFKSAASSAYVGGHFLFEFANNDPNFDSGIAEIRQPLNISQLSPRLRQVLPHFDYVIVNVATWWTTGTVGSVVDVDSEVIEVDGGIYRDEEGPHFGEWQILNESLRGRAVDYATLMERGLHLISARLKKGAVLVWRSEALTDCSARSFRQSVVPVLRRMNIPVLNISEATCDYLQVQPTQTDGTHLCFPSVALRNWLKMFETQFI